MKIFWFCVMIIVNWNRSVQPLRTCHGERYETLKLFDMTSWKIMNEKSTSIHDCTRMCLFEDTCFGFLFNKTSGRQGNCQLLSITQVLFQREQDLVTDPVLSQDIAYYPVQKGCLVPNCPVTEEYVFNVEICFCIKYYPTFLLYADASNVCKQDGGELARIDNLSKQTFATQLLVNTWLVTLDVSIQGFYHNVDENWYFDDATRLNFTFWSPNGAQPNLNGEEYIYLRPTENGGWHDTGDYARPFLCEITTVK